MISKTSVNGRSPLRGRNIDACEAKERMTATVTVMIVVVIVAAAVFVVALTME
jgi:hypothetical protein